jgi:hypothetical protein
MSLPATIFLWCVVAFIAIFGFLGKLDKGG